MLSLSSENTQRHKGVLALWPGRQQCEVEIMTRAWDAKQRKKEHVCVVQDPAALRFHASPMRSPWGRGHLWLFALVRNFSVLGSLCSLQLIWAHSNVLGEKQVSDLSKKIVTEIHEHVIHDMSLGQKLVCPDSFMLPITPGEYIISF